MQAGKYNSHSTYTGRKKSEEFTEIHIPKIFSNYKLIPLGCESLIDQYEVLGNYLFDSQNANNTSYLLEYLPDYILIDSEGGKLYFLEIKFSNSPLGPGRRLNQIKNQSNYRNASSMTVGVVAREAYYSYRKYFPETILIYATPYNQQVLFAQSISNLPAIHVENDQNIIVNSQNYDQYEIGTNNYFTYMRNSTAQGSGTPSVNISLNDMPSIEEFFKTINIELNKEDLEKFRSAVINRGVYFGQGFGTSQCKAFFESNYWYQKRYM